MNWKILLASALCLMTFYSGVAAPAAPAVAIPMKQGLHQWQALNGQLMLVVGTYQDSTSFRRSYTFYFKDGKQETWNQVPFRHKSGRLQFEWDSASGAEVTLADGIVVSRGAAVYFIAADKRADQGYQEKGDISVTWYRLMASGDDMPDDPAYQFKPEFTRTYPKSAMTVESILGKELALQPHQ